MINQIKEAVYGLLVLSLSSGILISFQGKKSKTAPYVRYLLSLILLLMLLSPLVSVLNAWNSLRNAGFSGSEHESADADTQEDGLTFYEQTAAAYAEQQAEEEMRLYLAMKTGIPHEDIALDFTLDSQNPEAIVITAANVKLSSARYRILTEKIKAYVEDTLLCPCTVVINREVET